MCDKFHSAVTGLKEIHPAETGLIEILKIFTDGDRLGCSNMRTAAAVEHPAALLHQVGCEIRVSTSVYFGQS